MTFREVVQYYDAKGLPKPNAGEVERRIANALLHGILDRLIKDGCVERVGEMDDLMPTYKITDLGRQEIAV